VLLPPPPPAGQLASWSASQSAADLLAVSSSFSLPLIVPVQPIAESRPFEFRQKAADGSTIFISARTARVQVRPSDEPDMMQVSIDLDDVVRHLGNDLGGITQLSTDRA